LTVNGPLDGIRVLDATQMLAGPLCTMRLVDLGADVIKIEAPGSGEWTRTHGFGNAEINGHTTAFLGLNRNKRSVTVDLKNDDGRAVFDELVAVSDVFIQNWRVGTADRLGVGYERLAQLNPGLVYCSISGYGETGPYVTRPGQDLVMQGYSGSMFSVGSRDDPPLPGALWAADAMTAYHAGLAILAALLSRASSGTGQKVELNMLAIVMDAQTQELTTYLNLELLPERSGAPLAHAWVTAPYGVYKTKDGYITLAQAPLHVLGEAVDDDRLRAMIEWSDGVDHRDEVYEILADKIPAKTTAEWLAILDEHKLWAGPVYTYKDLADDIHVRETEMISEIEHPAYGRLRTPAVPVRFSSTPASNRSAPPLLGEHTESVLTELLGKTQTQLEALAQAGAIAAQSVA
jgi:crotonobetainyl-CoA:carnitine CoA-transferase CaiB-like acyl-CoA transferase